MREDTALAQCGSLCKIPPATRGCHLTRHLLRPSIGANLFIT
jgi:hypothetical protein